MMINAIPLNNWCRYAHVSIDTVSKVVVVAEERVSMGILDDRSGSYKLALQVESWPLSECATMSSISPVPFSRSAGIRARQLHSFREAKAAYLRPMDTPVLAYIDDVWYPNLASTLGRSDQVQWGRRQRPFTSGFSCHQCADTSYPIARVLISCEF